ncbi:MAG TPA: flavin reductase family protein [Acetobacteraceae bacterium]|nr:flavin reductase family protein [Acetobacteraceae bacterium]
MLEDDKKFALRMIPYGVFVVTAINPATGAAAALTAHWVTQTSFSPCLLAVCIKADHPARALIQQTNRFALNILGKADSAEALTLARPAILTGSPNDGTAAIGGWGASWGRHGTLLLQNAVAVLECDMRAMMEAGDHYPVIAEPIDVHVRLPPAGRPDSMTLRLEDLGETIFYGG